MVTPTNGTANFVFDNGETRNVSFYIADVVATDIKWNFSGISVATSQSFINAPRNCVLRDISISSGPTVMKTLIIKRDDVPTGNALDIAQHLNSLPSRPVLNIPFRYNAKITAEER